jgi:DNA-binding Xre family transcriptional regulator
MGENVRAKLHDGQVHSCRMTHAECLCKSALMDADQDAARRFVKEILRITGWTANRLAKEAAISHTTISRFLNNEDVTHTLSTRTLSKIRAAASQEIAPEQLDALWLISQRRPTRLSG